MGIRILETRNEYEEVMRDPALVLALDFPMGGFGYSTAQCAHCLSLMVINNSGCPNCHAPTGDNTPFFMGLLKDRSIYVSRDVMTSKLTDAERGLYPPENLQAGGPLLLGRPCVISSVGDVEMMSAGEKVTSVALPPPPRSWFAKILDFLQAGI